MGLRLIADELLEVADAVGTADVFLNRPGPDAGGSKPVRYG